MDKEIKFDEHYSAGDTMSVLRGRGAFHFEIDEPWAGCTETGFGQTNQFDMTDEQARQLLAFLQAHLGSAENA